MSRKAIRGWIAPMGAAYFTFTAPEILVFEPITKQEAWGSPPNVSEKIPRGWLPAARLHFRVTVTEWGVFGRRFLPFTRFYRRRHASMTRSEFGSTWMLDIWGQNNAALSISSLDLSDKPWALIISCWSNDHVTMSSPPHVPAMLEAEVSKSEYHTLQSNQPDIWPLSRKTATKTRDLKM